MTGSSVKYVNRYIGALLDPSARRLLPEDSTHQRLKVWHLLHGSFITCRRAISGRLRLSHRLLLSALAESQPVLAARELAASAEVLELFGGRSYLGFDRLPLLATQWLR